MYFKWLFTKKPSLAPMDAIIRFNEEFKGCPLLVSKEISVIKSKPLPFNNLKSFIFLTLIDSINR